MVLGVFTGEIGFCSTLRILSFFYVTSLKLVRLSTGIEPAQWISVGVKILYNALSSSISRGLTLLKVIYVCLYLAAVI